MRKIRNGRLSIALLAATLIVLMVSASTAATPSTQLGLWRDINPDAYISPPANPQLNGVYMLSSTNGWAVGDSRPTTNTTTGLPAIFHYDGSTWNLVPAPKFQDFPNTPTAYNLTSVSFGPPNVPISTSDGWAVGFSFLGTSTQFAAGVPTGTALHWDGTSWRVQTSGLSTTNPDAGPLRSVFMVGSQDVWAVGQTQAPGGIPSGTFWHWTGLAGLGGGWNEPTPPVSSGPLYSVFMISSTEGWAVGNGGSIFHYFAGTWSAFTTPVSQTLRSVFMVSPTEGWAVGDGGVIIHYISGVWVGPVSPGTTINNLDNVYMLSPTEGWAFGKAGNILHYYAGTWTKLPQNLVPTAPVAVLNFNSAYFNSVNDGWIVGTDGLIMHYDGVNYGTVTSPTVNNFTSVSFGPPLSPSINPNDGWAVGNASTPATTYFANAEPTIYHWNGFVWTKGVAIGTSNNLNTVFMVSTNDVWAAGGGLANTATCTTVPLTLTPCPVILHYNGGSWVTVTPPPGQYVINSIFMVNSNEGWAVGRQARTLSSAAIILHYTSTGGVGTWATFPNPQSPTTLPGLNSVFMLSPTEGWAVGNNATIIHYTVSLGVGTWTPVAISGVPPLSTFANLTSIFMLSPTLGWVVGGIEHGNGPGSCVGPISCASATGPIIINWDGTKWSQVPAPTIPGGISPDHRQGHLTGLLRSVYCTSQDNCWTVGNPGKQQANVMHWDGTEWYHVTLTPALLGLQPPILTSVYMTSPTTGWIVGAAPQFPRFCWSCFNPTPTTQSPYFNPAPPVAAGGPTQALFLKPLSTILEYAPFNGVYGATTTTTATVTAQATSTGTATSLATRTVIATSTLPAAGGAPTSAVALVVIAVGVAVAAVLIILAWRRIVGPPSY